MPTTLPDPALKTRMVLTTFTRRARSGGESQSRVEPPNSTSTSAQHKHVPTCSEQAGVPTSRCASPLQAARQVAESKGGAKGEHADARSKRLTEQQPQPTQPVGQKLPNRGGSTHQYTTTVYCVENWEWRRGKRENDSSRWPKPQVGCYGEPREPGGGVLFGTQRNQNSNVVASGGRDGVKAPNWGVWRPQKVGGFGGAREYWGVWRAQKSRGVLFWTQRTQNSKVVTP